MPFKQFNIYYLIFIIFYSPLSLVPYLLFLPRPAYAIPNPIPPKVLAASKVTATVPGLWWLELTGWTSPSSLVELTMETTLKRITRADSTGYFVFRLALPQNLRPFCLISTDIANTTSSPVCIPPPPLTQNVLVKEIVLPPSIIIQKGQMTKDETVAAEGYTLPNVEVIPYLFSQKSRTQNILSSIPLIDFISNFKFQISNSVVYAAELPKPRIVSDANGFFQFNLPTGDYGKNRLFVGANFQDNPTPKSTTLVFDIVSSGQIIAISLITYLLALISSLLAFLRTLQGIILTEIGIVCILLYLILGRKKKKSKALYLNPNKAITISKLKK
jgi:hypothetical protein